MDEIKRMGLQSNIFGKTWQSNFFFVAVKRMGMRGTPHIGQSTDWCIRHKKMLKIQTRIFLFGSWKDLLSLLINK